MQRAAGTPKALALPSCSRGKPQLRIEEARRFTCAALSLFEETERPLAIGARAASCELDSESFGNRSQGVFENSVSDCS